MWLHNITLITLFFPLTHNAFAATEGENEIERLRPVAEAIENRKYDLARSRLEEVCSSPMSRRCRYVWARYHEARGEKRAAQGAYQNFLAIAKKEPHPDEKLRIQINDAERVSKRLSKELTPIHKVPKHTDPTLPSPIPFILETKPSPTSNVPAIIEIENDLPGTLVTGLSGYKNGLTIDKGVTRVIQQPGLQEELTFMIPGLFRSRAVPENDTTEQIPLFSNFVRKEFTASSGTVSRVQINWRSHISDYFTEFRQDDNWDHFVRSRKTPAAHQYGIPRVTIGFLVPLWLSAITSFIVLGACHNSRCFGSGNPPPGESIAGAVGGVSGVAASIVTVYTLWAIPKPFRMPLPGRDKNGNAAEHQAY